MSVLSKWVFGVLVAGAFVLGGADRAQAQPGRGGGSRGGAGCHSGGMSGMAGMNSMSARPGNSQMTTQVLAYQRSQWQAQLQMQQMQQMLAQQQQWQQMQAQQAWQQQQLMAAPRGAVPQQRLLQAR